MRKPVFCICETKGVDQLRGFYALFCFILDSTIPLHVLLKASSAVVQSGLCRTSVVENPNAALIILSSVIKRYFTYNYNYVDLSCQLLLKNKL